VTEYRIYQTRLTDAQHREINEKGWNGVEWGRDYIDATMMFTENGEPIDRPEDTVARAVGRGWFRHTWILEADDLDHLFAIANYMRDQDRIVWRDKKAKSASVGNVVFDEVGNGFICMSLGWHPMAPEARSAFLGAVSTYLPATTSER